MHYIIPYAVGASARLGPNLFLHFYTQDQWHCTIVCWQITILWILLCSTRISNELGAGNPKAAQGIVRVVVILGIVDGVIVSTFFVCCRHILGYAYSNDKEVVDYVSDIVPILCGSFTADSLIGALSGELYVLK